MIKKFISLSFITCLLIGCAPSIKIVSEFADTSYSIGQVSAQSKVLLYMAENVKVMEFKKSYETEYNSDWQFSQTVQKQTVDSMKSILGCTASLNTNLQVAAALTGTQTTAEKEAGFSLAAAEDFILFVKGVEISNKRGSVVMMAGGGMSGNSEKCVVTMHAELWNVKENKKVLAYAAVGRSEVSMFSHGASLKEAVGDAVGNMILYLKTGVTQ